MGRCDAAGRAERVGHFQTSSIERVTNQRLYFQPVLNWGRSCYNSRLCTPTSRRHQTYERKSHNQQTLGRAAAKTFKQTKTPLKKIAVPGVFPGAVTTGEASFSFCLSSLTPRKQKLFCSDYNTFSFKDIVLSWEFL